MQAPSSATKKLLEEQLPEEKRQTMVSPVANRIEIEKAESNH